MLFRGNHMSDETDDDIENHGPSAMTVFIRKVAFMLAAVFAFWTYASHSLNSTPLPQVVQKIEVPVTTKALPKPATPIVSETPPPPPPPPVIANPAETITHEEELAHLHQHVEPVEKPAEPNSIDKEQIAHLEALLAAQEKALQELKTQIAGIQAEKTQMNDAAAQSNRKFAALAAYGMLKDTMRNGEPFAVQLNQLYKLLPPENKESDHLLELLDKIKPYAEKGIPTPAFLMHQFSKRLPLALAPNADDHSWQANVQSLVRIRKVGEQQGSDDEAILARAEAKLNRRDISGALQELESLSKPAADVMAPWTTNAKTFIDMNNAIDALQLALVAEPNA